MAGYNPPSPGCPSPVVQVVQALGFAPVQILKLCVNTESVVVLLALVVQPLDMSCCGLDIWPPCPGRCSGRDPGRHNGSSDVLAENLEGMASESHSGPLKAKPAAQHKRTLVVPSAGSAIVTDRVGERALF